MAEGLLRFISADECGETGYVVSKVLTSGKHTLEFDFGRQKAYAHNDTGENLDFEGWESFSDGDTTLSGSNWSNVAVDDCDWQADSAGTPSSYTGHNIDHPPLSGCVNLLLRGNGFAKSMSLLKIGLVDKVERDDGTYYQLSKRGKSLIESLNMIER